MDFEDPRLKNILKLKQEFEKELQKMGKLKKTKTTVKRKDTVKIKVEIAPPANVNSADTTTLLDISRQDYDASDGAVVKALRSTLAKVGDVRRRTLVDGIIKLLEGDVEGARRSFESFENVDFEYMLGVLKLYNSESDVLEYSLKLLKKYPKSPKPYLLLSEVMLALGRYEESVKFLDAFAKLSNDPYADLVLKTHNGDRNAKKAFTVAVQKGGFKTFLAMLSVYIDPDPQKARRIADTLKKKENPCCRYFSRYWSGEDPKDDFEKYPYCSRLNVLKKAWDFTEDRIDSDPRETMVWNDPLVNLFLGFYSYNVGEKKSADEYFQKFSESIPKHRAYLYKSSRVVSKIGMRMFTSHIDEEPFLFLKDLSSGEIDSGLKQARMNGIPENHIDVAVSFEDPEVVRMFFGFRHCRFLYGS